MSLRLFEVRGLKFESLKPLFLEKERQSSSIVEPQKLFFKTEHG